MNKEKEKILEELKVKRSNLQERVPQNIVIQNIKLLGAIQLNEVEKDKNQEGLKTAKLYLVEEYNKETDEIMLKYYADDEFIGIDNKGEFIPTGLAREKYDNIDSIKDVLENLEEKEEIQKGAAEKEKTQEIYDLNELEVEKEQEEKGISKNEDKEEIEERKLTADKSGATSLDQEVDRRTLRNLMDLEEDDAYIKPISASLAKEKYGVNVNSKDALEIIKNNGESRLADSSVVKQDVQEGNNSFNKDLNMKVDGSVEYESNTTSFELANMPNHYISIGYDDMTTKKEIKFSKRSGREGHREPEKELLKEGASEYIDPDQRNMRRRNEEGIGEPDEIVERYEAEKEAGCEDIRVEDVDNYENNDTFHIDPDDKIEGTDITWRQFANKCGYRGEDGLQKAHKEFIDYKLSHKDLANDEVVEEIVEEIENEMPGPNRDRR